MEDGGLVKKGEFRTLFLAFLVSFFLGAGLLPWLGVGGAALATCGDDVAFLELAALVIAAAVGGAEGGGMALCCAGP